jgi:hypothetical protein
MFRKLLVALVSALALASPAQASGGHYVFDGGTSGEQAQVRQALNASTFDWNIVPGQVTIHIVRGIPNSEALPGEIWLEADLLDSGTFSWGVVQHEYAHQVDFLVLDDAQRATLETQLGGTAWCYGDAPALLHSQYGCERFASTLAWSYWQSSQNCMKPSYVDGESGGMAPAGFRALMTSLLGATQNPAPAAANASASMAPRYAPPSTHPAHKNAR